MYYLVEATRLNDGTEAKALYSFETLTEATAQFHNTIGYSMNNTAVNGITCMVIRENCWVEKQEYWERPQEVTPDESGTDDGGEEETTE